MSDYDENDLETPGGDEQGAEKRNWRRDLEEQARQAKQAAAEAEAAKRELAFLKAGIDLDSPQGKLLAKAYDGAPTAEAIKQFATEHGVIAPEAPEVPQDELAAHDRFATAAAGATQVSETDEFIGAMQNAQSEAEVLEILRKAGVPIDTSKPGGFLRPERMGSVPLQ